MKDFNSYIIEKLKINKDTKIAKGDLANFIMSIIQYDTKNNDVMKEIEKWIKETDVELVSVYCNKSNSDSKEYIKSLDTEIRNKIKLINLAEYVKEIKKFFPVKDNDKYIKYSDSKIMIRACDKCIEFEKKEYDILIKRETTIYDL